MRRHQERLEEQAAAFQRRVAELQDDLVESRSEVDSLQLQLAEQSDTIADLKVNRRRVHKISCCTLCNDIILT